MSKHQEGYLSSYVSGMEQSHELMLFWCYIKGKMVKKSHKWNTKWTRATKVKSGGLCLNWRHLQQKNAHDEISILCFPMIIPSCRRSQTLSGQSPGTRKDDVALLTLLLPLSCPVRCFESESRPSLSHHFFSMAFKKTWHRVGMIEAPAAFLCNYPVSLLGLKLLPCKSTTSLLPRKRKPNTNLPGCSSHHCTYSRIKMVFLGCWAVLWNMWPRLERWSWREGGRRLGKGEGRNTGKGDGQRRGDGRRKMMPNRTIVLKTRRGESRGFGNRELWRTWEGWCTCGFSWDGSIRTRFRDASGLQSQCTNLSNSADPCSLPLWKW